jgi:hypothetical protein
VFAETLCAMQKGDKMKPIKHAACFLLVVVCNFLALAQQTATTDDGKKVILKKDGTWEYAKEEPKRTGSFDFRKANWGMSKKQVKATESGKVERDDDEVLAYSGTVSGMDALIAYIFIDSKLVRAKYVFLPQHTNKNDYIVDYKGIKETLTDKYGSPKSDDSYWRNDLYKTDYSEWGFAVSLGHLTYSAEWETESSEISLILSGENYKIHLATEYISKQLKNLEETARQKKKKTEF